jgi:hypothetical protein
LLLVVHKSVLIFIILDHEGVGGLANLAFERLPEVRGEICRFFGLAFDFKPRLKALQVDAAYSACALTALE